MLDCASTLCTVLHTIHRPSYSTVHACSVYCHKRITPCITNLLGKSVLREKQASLTIVVTVVSLIYVIKPLGALTQILVWRCHDFCDIFMATLPGPVI